ncbi:MAG: glycosyltransferase family 39 protein [Bryobacteraceae bacterium]
MRIFLQIGFAMLCGLTAYGLWSERILTQQIWEGQRWQRLFFAAGAYSATAALFHRFGPRWFLLLLGAGSAVYSVAAAGFGAPAAVLYFLASALVLGDAILDSREPALSLLLGVSVYVTLFNFIAPLRVHLPITYLVLLAIPLILFRSRLRGLWQRSPGFERSDYAGAALLGFVLLVHLLVALKPEVSADGLAMHLAIPSFIESQHRWTFDVHNYLWAVMPMNGDWAFSMVYLLGGEFAARLLNYAALIVTLTLVFGAVRRWLSPGLAAVAVALVASAPVVQTVTGSLMVENIWTAFIVGAVIALDRYRESGNRRSLFAVSLLAGTAVATKWGAAVFVFALAPFLVAALIRRRVRAGAAAALLAIFLITAMPPYVNAYVRTGNPVFPHLNAVFRSPLYETVSIRDPQFSETLKWSTLYDVTFRTHKYFEGQHGGLGFQYFLFLPLALIWVRRGSPFLFHAALGVALAGSGVVFLSTPNLRYIYPALFLSTIALAPLLGAFRPAAIAAAVITGLNIYCLGTSGWYHKDFLPNAVLKPREVEDYLRFHAPERRLIDVLNAIGVRAPVAFLEGNKIAGLRVTAYSNTWHCVWFERALAGADSPEAVLRIAREHRIRYFIAPRANLGVELRPVLRAFLDQYTTPVVESGRCYLARLRTD